MENKNSKVESSDHRLEWLFEKIVVQHPDLCAIDSPEGNPTYTELNAKSNRIAHCLSATLTGSDPLETAQKHSKKLNASIVTMIESNVDQIAVQIGILKSSRHFVCLDPCHPSDRLIGILEESSPDAIVIDRSVLRHPSVIDFIKQQSTNVFTIDIVAKELGGFENVTVLDNLSDFSDQNSTLIKNSNAIAYVAYTSGSTGKPKGIIQSHRSFSQFINWQAKEFQIGANKRFIQWASISYDASFCEIFGSLCFGATLCVESPEVRFNPLLLSRWVTKIKADILQVVPSFCRQIIEVMRDAPVDDGTEKLNGASVLMPNLKFLLLAGEALPSDLPTAWRSLQDARIYNQQYLIPTFVHDTCS